MALLTTTSQTSYSLSSQTPKGGDKVASRLILCLILCAILFQKFAYTVTETSQLHAGFLALMILTGWGFFSGKLIIIPGRVSLYLMMAAGLFLSQFFHIGTISPLSIALLFVIHIPYLFQIRPGLLKQGIELEYFQKIMVALSLLGFCQYFLQYLVGTEFAFFFDYWLPPSFMRQAMNKLNYLQYGVAHFKSNGIFFAEPSMFSQFQALALIIEFIYFKNVKRYLIFLAGIAVTFSGTGLMLLVLITPLYLIAKKKFALLFFFAAVALSFPLWGPEVGLELTVKRIGEFGSERSSGYSRFIAPFKVLGDMLLSDPVNALFGYGAGSMMRTIQQYDLFVSSLTWSKLLFEYGLIGCLFYLCFLLTVVFSSKKSLFLKAALLVEYFLLGEYLLPADVHPIILALLAWPDEALKPAAEWIKTKPKPFP